LTLHIVILAGGSGTRFWPASTRDVPKQFLPLANGAPLLRATYERIAPLAPPERVAVVTSAATADAVRKLLPELPPANVIGEPVARNTAAACAVAARWALARDANAVVVTVPADHLVSPAEDLRAKLAAAAAHAEAARSLVTLGLQPAHAATGFGWIRLAHELGRVGPHLVHRVADFIEKPDRRRAEAFFAAGGHLWNLGMFAWRADVFLAEVARHLPEVARRAELAAESMERAYDGMPAISVDRGVLEHAADVDCLPCTFEWDDVGSFTAFARHLPHDEHGNAAVGPLVALDSKDCFAWAEDGRMTALLGVKDVIVVHSHGATLVVHRSRAEEVRRIVEHLGPAGLDRFA
jgi:mannose-1-phosphate guanylyltransferase